MQLSYMTVDVFTDRRFGGNPLAVVTNAQGLATDEMQSIAGEFNLAETAFVLPPRDPSHTAEVRIFTPRAELPFAGHPNIGTAFVLARPGTIHGRAVGDPLMFETQARSRARACRRPNHSHAAKISRWTSSRRHARLRPTTSRRSITGLALHHAGLVSCSPS
jgi:predicted PhzF superfamily epimerase YddE/YHI9